MWMFILNLIGGPIVGGIINAYKAKLESVNTTEAHAVDLAKAEIMGEIQQRQTEASIIREEQGWWVTALPRPMFAFIFVLYIGKCVVWDKVFGWGTTDPLSDNLMWAQNTILIGYFGGRTIEKVARIFNRK